MFANIAVFIDMSEILDDIFEEVELKPNQSKKIVKWVIRIALALIAIAFTLGGLKVSITNKIKNIETSVKQTSTSLDKHKKEDGTKFDDIEDDIKHLNNRIDEVYKKD